MPRVLLTEAARRAERERKADEAIVGRIAAYLAVTGRNMGQLAERCGMKERTLYNREKSPGDFRLSEYRRLCEELDRVLDREQAV